MFNISKWEVYIPFIHFNNMFIPLKFEFCIKNRKFYSKKTVKTNFPTIYTSMSQSHQKETSRSLLVVIGTNPPVFILILDFGAHRPANFVSTPSPFRNPNLSFSLMASSSFPTICIYLIIRTPPKVQFNGFRHDCLHRRGTDNHHPSLYCHSLIDPWSWIRVSSSSSSGSRESPVVCTNFCC